MNAVNLFSGAGGWEVGAAGLGLSVTGIELDSLAHATAKAAGHQSIQASVLDFNPYTFDGVEGLIGSPPCQTYSAGGTGAGRRALEEMQVAVREVAKGHKLDLSHLDPRTGLVLEPLRYARIIRPKWIALEQVPAVLPVWKEYQAVLRSWGYRCGVGVVNAEEFGVPQTRQRAILIARLGGGNVRPTKTHRAYRNGLPEMPLWRSMDDVLPWRSDDLVGFPRRADTDNGVVVLNGTRYRARDLRAASRPSFAVTSKVRSWSRWRGDVQHRITQTEASVLQTFPTDYPWQGSPTRQGLQVGNAIPPLLARAVLKAATSW